jgi:FtsP/CotA-like multicopper oxidase with cupredoxin domain
MQPDRREFLKSGLAAGFAGLAGAGLALADDLDDKVAAEMKDRLKCLAPPDGVAADPRWGLPQLSPPVTPFTEDLSIPPIIVPEIDMSGDAYRRLKDGDWWEKFKAEFGDLAKRLRKRPGLDIGALPVPKAHQRFWEYRPVGFYILVEKEFPWQFHPDYGDKSWSWGYEALAEYRDAKRRRRPFTPGPIFRARYGEPILVRRINDLPEVGDARGNAKIRFALPSTTCHLHNAHTASESDGFPGDWINPRQYWDHHYANFPSGQDSREKLTSLWYHDHRMDYTAANIYAGLDGFYTLFDELKDADLRARKPEDMQDVGDEHLGWRLPSGRFDVPLMLHDLAFGRDEHSIPQLVFDGFNTAGVLGDRYTVNRKIQPRLEVEARKYRFRIYDGGPSRFYELFLCPEDPKAEDVPFVVVTGDGNFQPSPLLAHSIYLGVAQRVDVVVDFSRMKPGEHLFLVNRLRQVDGRGPDGRIVERPERPGDYSKFLETNSVMRFDVVARRNEDPSRIQLTFRELPPVDLTEVRRERIWEFDTDGGLWTINNKIYDPNRIDAEINEDTAEIWTIRNSGGSWHHPIHSHFTEHIILEINGAPQYQARAQTGLVPRRMGTFETALITPGLLEKPLRRLLEKDAELSTQLRGFIRGDTVAAKEARKALAPDRALTPAEAQDAVSKIFAVIDQIALESVDDFRRAAGFLRDFLKINLIVDRFMGGPRRDIVLLFPESEVKIFMRRKDFRGKYVMHCHNMVHEDHAMMIRWDISAPGLGSGLPRSADEVINPELTKPHIEPHAGEATGQAADGRRGPRHP